ncbi:hypothetical protein DEU56DRAFT_832735 [Suillus clintonianus]|uniref:uncharacterized protein n=1 Tax=Suillus clintonianus TaxID=1904413 RepID=UPI001B88697A|nr:uncharacterized protein DEU56DRAFT_832735 [Suillus clintonianus]KAG2122236.1 hypothetical protein DEU56DRAFT_832735 [Suillus clintonianus]
MPPAIMMSELSGSVFSQASLILAKQQVNQVDLPNIDWAKLWAAILSRASDVLTKAKQLVPKLLRTVLSGALIGLTAINTQSIIHPYAVAGILILISAATNIGIFLALLQSTGAIALFLCFLPVYLIIWCLGFRSQGVQQVSLASQYQASHYGGYVPRGSGFSQLQSLGATAGMLTFLLTLVSLLSYAGAVIVLGREWGWWLQ